VFLLALLTAPMFAATVTLTWTQSDYDSVCNLVCTTPNSYITSNNVYRSGTTGGPYTEIYASSSPITTYSDTRSPGTYYYVVTVVIVNPGNVAPGSYSESAYSNEVTAIVPGSSTPVPRSGRGSTF
jgi:hypothetical protein